MGGHRVRKSAIALRESWRARCSAMGTPGSGGGSEKPISSNADRALRVDLTKRSDSRWEVQT